MHIIVYKKWKKLRKREEALLKCWEIRKRMEDLGNWKTPEWGVKKNAKGVASQGNHYAKIDKDKIDKSASFAQSASDSPLERKGLPNPIKFYLERRKTSC